MAMGDPTLEGLLRAIGEGDQSARQALTDYLVERGDDRSERVRTAQSLSDVLDYFLPQGWISRIKRRLQENGFQCIEGPTYPCSHFVRPGHLTRATYWTDADNLYHVFAIKDFASLDLRTFKRYVSDCYRWADNYLQEFDVGSVNLCSFAIAAVPEIDLRLADHVRRRKLDSHISFSPNRDGYEIPMIYASSRQELHFFQTMPIFFNRVIYQGCRDAIQAMLIS